MLATAERPSIPLPNVDRRRFQRVRLDLPARYMLADGRELACQITNMSPGGVAVAASVAGGLGERVVAYVDHIGRIEGVIARQFPAGFALAITSTKHKREKLAAQLTWLANRDILPEQRRHLRIAPLNPSAHLVFPNGTQIRCRVIDISQSGAGVASDRRPVIGSRITIGRTAGRVARHIDGGFAIEFVRLQHQDFIEENVTEG
jgi:hypothetical protein